MVDKKLIGIWRNMVKPPISSWLLKSNYEGMGKQDKEEFERDFDEILDLALIGLDCKAQPYSLDEWCTDCKEYDHEKHCCPRYNRVIRDAMKMRKRGKWIDKSGGIEGAWNYCSVCGEQAIDLYDFCPNCGADMREGGEDE